MSSLHPTFTASTSAASKPRFVRSAIARGISLRILLVTLKVGTDIFLSLLFYFFVALVNEKVGGMLRCSTVARFLTYPNFHTLSTA